MYGFGHYDDSPRQNEGSRFEIDCISGEITHKECLTQYQAPDTTHLNGPSTKKEIHSQF